MDKFKKKNYFQKRKLSIEDLGKYYAEERLHDYEDKEQVRHVKIRDFLHPFLHLAVKIDRVLTREKIRVIADEREKTKRPRIYACTHIGGNDVHRVLEAIKEHAYPFIGDPKDEYKNIVGFYLKLNGVVYVELDDKTDRKVSYAKSVELLTKGCNLVIFPEGAWNLSENLPVLGLFKGTARMAQEAKADIIPVALEQYDKTFDIKIGKNIKYEDIKDKDIEEINIELRDKMASLKWDIWENRKVSNREEITDEFKNNFKQDIVDKCVFPYTIEEVEEDTYKDKNITTPEEALEINNIENHDYQDKLNKINRG